MKPPVKKRMGNKRVGKKRLLSRTELARRIITDYADQLRRNGRSGGRSNLDITHESLPAAPYPN
jgi:hypothetical protein